MGLERLPAGRPLFMGTPGSRSRCPASQSGRFGARFGPGKERTEEQKDRRTGGREAGRDIDMGQAERAGSDAPKV